MKIFYLQHVPFEGLAFIESWIESKNISPIPVRIFNNDPFPNVEDVDMLIVMGGPMSVYEEDKHPWLVEEKRFIVDVIRKGGVVLGICLGAQLIADVLGARVYPNQHKEIGWFPIELTEKGAASELFGFLPKRLEVFHWHGDTFDLPPGAVRMARSEGCLNQAFVHGDRVVGLQFHLESTGESIRTIIQNCSGEIVTGKYIQDADAMVAETTFLDGIHSAMSGLMEKLFLKAKG
jgi:GMP synthase (glutamine-hydrolysing)